MRPAEFTYHRPSSVDEAVSLLSADVRPLAGGHSLLPMMKLRLATPSALVDLAGVAGLDAVEEDGDSLRIGALATHAAVAGSELVRSRCPVLAEAAGDIGDRQVRNRGTIGGSVAHCDPAADYPTVLTALDAGIVVVGREGEREIPAGEFFRGIFETACGPGELVVAVKVPAMTAGRVGAYEKHRHPASRYAVVGVAAVAALEGGTCTRANVVIGGVAGKPVVATAVGQVLTGASPSAETIAAAAEKVSEALPDALSDTYASGEYRRHLAAVLARRALERAFDQAA
ncbi:MAG: xanthine dehydrogenase family protein subunit M [Actinobacteria bacterium]|nr:MAG: xanthine dehydrogenase family protein subunit M [Actinomycetota bacterium]